ncbi:hypothetical protein MPSI1_002969 [Malassezia psittaci]|uniref:Transcription initiation factor TFIID subunit 10 n=1 Tax=Malassezia psittaci TaxID=1821823 RepID=A0AAF0FGV5_9BASI|nr:hypothetical protein MPSI1_002969 [Malassezia psittaci]
MAGEEMEEDSVHVEPSLRAPDHTPLEEDALSIPEEVQHRFRGAKVHLLNLLPPATATKEDTVAKALSMARAHGGQCVILEQESKPIGYVDMIDLVVEETEGNTDKNLSELLRPFGGTHEEPKPPTSYRIITPDTELAEAATFLQQHAFAFVTDAERKHILNIVTLADVELYMDNQPRSQALDSRSAEESQRDKSLADLLQKLGEFPPLIPDEVTDFYLERAGFQSEDVRLKRLLALATEKFVSDIASDAFHYARIRTNAGPSRARPGQGAGRDRARTVLTMDDLSAALGEYGIDARRADGYR